MRAMKTFLIVAVVLVIGVTVQGEDKTIYITTLSSTTMPSLDMANKPLEKVLDDLHAKVPDFHFVIFRSPNVPVDYPMLPAMKLENVHVDQFLNLIGDEFPGVNIKYNVDNYGQAPPLIEVNIRPDPANPSAGTPITPDPLIVRVFGLHDLISTRMVLLADKNVTEKQTTDDILSLVMAAQEQVDGAKLPVVKIHQPTRTLIFKGTTEQASLLEQTLNTLTNDENRVNDSYSRQLDHLKTENEQLHKQLHLPSTQPWK